MLYIFRTFCCIWYWFIFFFPLNVSVIKQSRLPLLYFCFQQSSYSWSSHIKWKGTFIHRNIMLQIYLIFFIAPNKISPSTKTLKLNNLITIKVWSHSTYVFLVFPIVPGVPELLTESNVWSPKPLRASYNDTSCIVLSY